MFENIKLWGKLEDGSVSRLWYDDEKTEIRHIEDAEDGGLLLCYDVWTEGKGIMMTGQSHQKIVAMSDNREDFAGCPETEKIIKLTDEESAEFFRIMNKYDS